MTGTVSNSGSGPSNYKNITEQTTYGVDKTVTQSNVSAGQINSQSVSVLVDKTVPAAEIPLLKSAISASVGLKRQAGGHDLDQPGLVCADSDDGGTCCDDGDDRLRQVRARRDRCRGVPVLHVEDAPQA